MSFSLLQIIKEWIAILFLLINPSYSKQLNTEKIEIAYNPYNYEAVTDVITIDYKEEKKYNNNIPSNVTNVINEGSVGLIYQIDGEEIMLREPINKIIEIGTGPLSTFTGSITGYGADCVGCSGTVSCRTPNGKHNLTRDGIEYNDTEYGTVKIIAADNSLFKCGTIIDITSKNKTFKAIVLDTGIAMRNAWRKDGKVLIDVAFNSESDPEVYQITDKSETVKFEIKRWGW